MMKLIRCLAFAAIFTPLSAGAQDFDAGLRAFDSGDYATALQEWRPLAEQGHAWSQYALGAMYELGQGVLQDYAEAVRWYRAAAEQGDPYAQTNLGVMYLNGHGVAQDYAEAARWYRAAAEQGIPKAQANLGAMYGLGLGVAQDYVSAHMWSNIAAAAGNEIGHEQRELAASLMTADAIAEAQRRARICMASDYQDCD